MADDATSLTPASVRDAMRDFRDDAAWAAFWAWCEPRIRAYCPRSRFPGLDADEVVGRVAFALVGDFARADPSFDPERSFRCWLARVVGNEIRALRRARGRKTAGRHFAAGGTPNLETLRHAPSPEGDAPAGDAPLAADLLLLRKAYQRTRDAWAAGRKDGRVKWRAFHLRWLKGKDAGAVGRELGLSPARVAQAVFQIKRDVEEAFHDLRSRR